MKKKINTALVIISTLMLIIVAFYLYSQSVKNSPGTNKGAVIEEKDMGTINHFDESTNTISFTDQTGVYIEEKLTESIEYGCYDETITSGDIFDKFVTITLEETTTYLKRAENNPKIISILKKDSNSNFELAALILPKCDN